MSQIEEIRAFVMVVETGSLTQAAERLGIAVSAVSRRLKDLELRLGAPLIQRTTRRMYLNEVGQGFYERCKAVLDELEAAQQEVLDAFRHRLHNISRLMDCVGCDRCRLWGKLQVQSHALDLRKKLHTIFLIYIYANSNDGKMNFITKIKQSSIGRTLASGYGPVRRPSKLS